MKAFPIVLAMTVLAILVCGSLADDSSDSTAADNVSGGYSAAAPVAAKYAGEAAGQTQDFEYSGAATYAGKASPYAGQVVAQDVAKVASGGNGAVSNSKVADRMDATKSL